MQKAIIITAIVLVVVCIGTLVYFKLSPEQITIPKEVTKQNEEKKLTTYMPTWLPGTYKIDKDSFSRQDDGKVFTFSATDENRNRLFFSQQPIPKEFDFKKFYSTNFTTTQKLGDVPFESVYAKSPFGKTWMLSIVTDKTWIMMTTDTPIDTVMAQKLVQEIKEY